MPLIGALIISLHLPGFIEVEDDGQSLDSTCSRSGVAAPTLEHTHTHTPCQSRGKAEVYSRIQQQGRTSLRPDYWPHHYGYASQQPLRKVGADQNCSTLTAEEQFEPRWCTFTTHHLTEHGRASLLVLAFLTWNRGPAGLLSSPAVSQHALGYVGHQNFRFLFIFTDCHLCFHC